MATPNRVPGQNDEAEGKSTIEAVSLVPPPPPVSTQIGQYYVRFTAKNETIGPLTEGAIRNMIQNRHLGITDMVCHVGSSTWTVLSESRDFSSIVLGTTTRSQFQGATCPNCQAHMAVILKRPTAPLILIWIGIFTSIALIGLPLIIIGLIWRAKSRAGYICPRCNYRTA